MGGDSGTCCSPQCPVQGRGQAGGGRCEGPGVPWQPSLGYAVSWQLVVCEDGWDEAWQWPVLCLWSLSPPSLCFLENLSHLPPILLAPLFHSPRKPFALEPASLASQLHSHSKAEVGCYPWLGLWCLSIAVCRLGQAGREGAGGQWARLALREQLWQWQAESTLISSELHQVLAMQPHPADVFTSPKRNGLLTGILWFLSVQREEMVVEPTSATFHEECHVRLLVVFLWQPADILKWLKKKT